MVETQKNWITLPNGQSHHLKYHVQLKTNKICWRWRVSYRRLPGQARLGGEGCYADISHCLHHWKEFLQYETFSPSSWYSQGRHLYTWRFALYIHVNVPFWSITWFSELLQCSQILKTNKQQKKTLSTTLTPKGHIWRWQILLPYVLPLKFPQQVSQSRSEADRVNTSLTQSLIPKKRSV